MVEIESILGSIISIFKLKIFTYPKVSNSNSLKFSYHATILLFDLYNNLIKLGIWDDIKTFEIFWI